VFCLIVFVLGGLIFVGFGLRFNLVVLVVVVVTGHLKVEVIEYVDAQFRSIVVGSLR